MKLKKKWKIKNECKKYAMCKDGCKYFKDNLLLILCSVSTKLFEELGHSPCNWNLPPLQEKKKVLYVKSREAIFEMAAQEKAEIGENFIAFKNFTFNKARLKYCGQKVEDIKKCKYNLSWHPMLIEEREG